MPRWLLPENISDVLPREARRVEDLRRGLLDLYRGYGYELVIPPLIEYVDSLLTGTGSDLDLRTFKLTDQARSCSARTTRTAQIIRARLKLAEKIRPFLLDETAVLVRRIF